MTLHPSSRKELIRVAAGTALCSGILVAALRLLSAAGIGSFDWWVFLSAVGGSGVAVGNFAALCLSIQKAVAIEDEKQRLSFLRGSYNGRLLLQGIWLAASLLTERIHVVAAALPLLFPGLVIFLRRGAVQNENT